MKLGLQLQYDDPVGAVSLAEEADRLGFHSVWSSEAWGADAVTVAAWVAARTERIGIGTAIMQMPARTPATTVMTAATLDLLSGGRVLLGLGTSGPQVVEGWHGEPWGKPLTRTREYVAIVRAGLRRETLEHHGEHYDLPYDGDGSTGLGKPLKLIVQAAAARGADLPRRDRAEERRPRSRDRRRVAPDLLLARAVRRGPSAPPRRLRPKDSRSPRRCRSSSWTTSRPHGRR